MGIRLLMLKSNNIQSSIVNCKLIFTLIFVLICTNISQNKERLKIINITLNYSTPISIKENIFLGVGVPMVAGYMALKKCQKEGANMI
jgi:hypothetical protein